MWKEYIFGISIILTVVGLIVLVFGILGMWFSDVLQDVLSLQQDVLSWSLYILIIGFIVLITGIFYLYEFLKNKRFLFRELETNKRSEFMKNHAELKNAVRNLPSKYREMLRKKEKQLRIK